MPVRFYIVHFHLHMQTLDPNFQSTRGQGGLILCRVAPLRDMQLKSRVKTPKLNHGPAVLLFAVTFTRRSWVSMMLTLPTVPTLEPDKTTSMPPPTVPGRFRKGDRREHNGGGVWGNAAEIEQH